MCNFFVFTASSYLLWFGRLIGLQTDEPTDWRTFIVDHCGSVDPKTITILIQAKRKWYLPPHLPHLNFGIIFVHLEPFNFDITKGGFALSHVIELTTTSFVKDSELDDVKEFFQNHPTKKCSRGIQQSIEKLGTLTDSFYVYHSPLP